MSHFFEFAVSSLLQTAWQSAVLVAIVLVLQWILRGRMPARWHAALWLVVLARLLVPAVPQSPASVFNLAHLAAWNGPALPETNGQFEQLPIAPDGTASDPAQNDTISAIPFPAAANSNGPASPVSTTAAPHASGWLRVVGGIWLAGAFILLVRVATMSLRLRTTLRRCRTVDDPRLLALLDDCRSQMHVARPVALLASPETVSPAVTASSRRAWIIVPESLLGELNPGELRLMLLHELAHLRRWDVLQQWLWTIAATLHWFNPIVWLAVRRMQADREIACDETVLACLDSAERLTYGRAILKVVETLSPVMPLAPAVGALDSASNLNRRILMIARYRRTSRLWTPSALLLVLGLCAIGLTDAVDKPVSAASAAAAAPVEAATVPSEQTQPPSTSAKGKLYVDALLRMTDPQGEKQVQGIIEVDPETGACRRS
jgi:beta-lactamase regulating signal transducer with metallopeptidase domain